MPEPTSPVTVVIPARFGSSRFPGKPLVALAGKPMIQHVYERAVASRGVARVLVATDDRRICDAVTGFGGAAVMTPPECRTGTDRVAAVVREMDGDVFLDLQGDEIPLDLRLLGELIEGFLACRDGIGMGTLKRSITTAAELYNPAIVKVTTDCHGDALFFSRSPIPYVRDGEGAVAPDTHYAHLGLYIYDRRTLLQLAGLPTGPLEEAEKLEQLRALEHGIRIRVWKTDHASLRVDTPADVDAAAAVLQRQEARRKAPC